MADRISDSSARGIKIIIRATRRFDVTVPVTDMAIATLAETNRLPAKQLKQVYRILR